MAAINYDDERFAEVEAEKKQALTENEQLYNGMINQSDQHYQQQIEATKEWGEKQQQLQQEQTDFTLQQIEQQKQQAEKDYKKEQSGAYIDVQKQSNQYSAQAEQMAASGLTHTGYSETTKAGMWNTYQNRMAAARESYNQAVSNFNNAMTEARLQNSSKQAEIAYNTLLQQLQLTFEGFQYKNTLLLDQANRKQEIENIYYGRYQDVVNQINQEKAQEEQQRQYDLNMAWQREQFDYQKEQDKKNYDFQQEQFKYQKEQTAISKEDSTEKPDSTTKYDGYTEHGNSKKTYNKKDYYFDNGYQPRYVNDSKLGKTGVTVGEVFGSSLGIKQSQNIWKSENNRYYIWDGSTRTYIDVTTKASAIKDKMTVGDKIANWFR